MGDVVRHSRPDRQAPHAAAGRLVLEHADDPGRALVRAGVQAESVLQVRVVRRGRHRDRPAVRDVGEPVSYTHLRAHETDSYLVCRLLLEKKKKKLIKTT